MNFEVYGKAVVYVYIHIGARSTRKVLATKYSCTKQEAQDFANEIKQDNAFIAGAQVGCVWQAHEELIC